jgi:DNA invertase Pin-like site-specific DNA recombinase
MSRKLRLDVLIRQSQRDDDSKSPRQQLDNCERCAAVNDYVIATVHDSGRSESGKTMARGTVEAALARIRSGQSDGVIVAWLDRFGRAPIEDAMSVLREIAKAGGYFVPADVNGGRPIDPDDPQAETNLVIQLQIARQQWLTTAKRFDRNRKDAIAAGKHISRPPLGYRFTDPTPRPRAAGVLDSRLVPDEQTVSLIPELFERKAAGASWLELARWLDSTASKPNGKQWARQTVMGIITSRTYLGEVRHGQHVKTGAHEPLVSASLWRRAQNEPGHRTPRGTYLLSGLVRCSGCGRNMRASSGGLRKPAVYVCVTPECKARYSTVVVDKIDAEVIEQFFARLDAFHTQAIADDDLAEASSEVERLGSEVERLAMVTPSHPKAVAAHQRALQTAENALADAEDHLAYLLTLKSQNGPDVQEIRSAWPTFSLDERREILRKGIDAILVRRAFKQGAGSVMSERIRVLFRGDAPADLLGRRRDIRSWTWNDDPGSFRLAA